MISLATSLFIAIFADVMVLNDIINEAATGPPLNEMGQQPSSPPTVSAAVHGRSHSNRFRPPSIGSLVKADLEKNRRQSRKVSMMYDDDEGPKLKERLTDAFYKGIDIFCVWDCCWAYVRLSEVCTSPT